MLFLIETESSKAVVNKENVQDILFEKSDDDVVYCIITYVNGRQLLLDNVKNVVFSDVGNMSDHDAFTNPNNYKIH